MYEFRKDDTGNYWLWPKRDPLPIQQRLVTSWHLDVALQYVKKRNVVIQAGGNCGQWPLWLASHFRHVYTFEPSPENFVCLTYNTRDHNNIYRYQCGLGDVVGRYYFEQDPQNCEGDHFDTAGPITCQIQQIKQLKTEVDFICLDVEGFEFQALKGAGDILKRDKPVILFENRHQQRYGYTLEKLLSWLRKFDYSIVNRASKDIILA